MPVAVPSPRLLAALLALLTLFVLAAATAPATASAAAARTRCADADRVTTPKRTARAARCLVNAERARLGARRLRFDGRLQQAARRQARAILRTRVFAHTVPGTPDLGGRIRAAGWRGRATGENLFWGTGRLRTARQVVAAWMRSPGHRANVLGRQFGEVGFVVAPRTPSGARGGVTVVAVFGA